jgi:putative ABC transport system permease protein
VAAFLLAMVALGLLGVLWQNIVRRTREIGLRRALGASRASIHRQIVLEQLLLATGGIGLGLLLAVQIPAFRLLDFIPRPVWLGAAALAVAAIYGLITLAALYPSLVAGRIEPAEALRAE